MLLPLVLLAIGSAVGGMIAIPHLVEPVLRLPVEPEAHPLWLPWVASLVAIGGIVVASYFYLLMTDLPGRVAAACAPLYRLFAAKYYFDDVYYAFVDKVVLKGSGLLWKKVDAGAIDGTVNTTGTLVDSVAGILRFAQTGLLRTYALLMLAGAVAVVGYILWP
jgi:NADH-quinone oxidoreductase subunit L